MSIQIPGLTIVEDYLTEEEEESLIHYIYEQPWLPVLTRRVQHYGYEYSYRPPYELKDATAIPQVFRKYAGNLDKRFNQVIVNEYAPGQGISKHTDHKTLFGERIASLSLGSATTIVFQYGEIKEEFYVLPRTLLIMEGDARWKFTHEIPARKSDKVDGKIIQRGTRISLTFRIAV
jgi:alkylated DNA repair dioxygenase AlkB